MKVTQKDIRELIENRIAINVEFWPHEELCSLRKTAKELCYSLGKDGRNGVVYISDSGKLYAVASRSSSILVLY